MTGARRRRVRIGLAGLLLVGVSAAGFLAWHEVRSEGDVASPRRPEAQPVRPGWGGLDDGPLSSRAGFQVAWTGTELLVYGGGAVDQGFLARSLNDGAAYDPSTGQWRLMADAPFTDPLFMRSSVWTGEELIVFGVLCNDQRTGPQESDPLCAPGTMAGAAYDPSADAWRPVDPPPDIVAEPLTYEEGILRLGWTGREAVFLMRGFYRALDVATGVWRRLPLPMPPLDDPAVDACVLDGDVAAVSFTDRIRGGVGASIEVSLVDPTAGSWRPSVQPAYPLQPAPLLLQAQCGAEDILLLPAEPLPGHRFDYDEGRWAQVAPAPVAIGANPISVWTGSAMLYFTGDDGVLSYEPASDAWRTLPDGGLPEGRSIVRAVWVGDRVVLVVHDDQVGQRLIRYMP